MGIADKAKAAQLAAARLRSKTLVRETSGASTDNSQLTSSPPTVYRLSKLNIPSNLDGMTKLVHSELQKIEQSQSVILTLWQEYQAQKSDLAQAKKQLQKLTSAMARAGIEIPTDN